MGDSDHHTYAITHVVGTSTEGIDAAIHSGIRTVAETVRHLDWFEVDEIRGYIDGSDVKYFQVTMKVGFRYENA
jgi:hypothetical protein